MLLPLTVHVPSFPHGVGFVLRIECCIGRGDGAWPARVVSPVGIFDCAGARDDAAEAQLRRLLGQGAVGRTRAVSSAPHPRGDGCLLHVDGFCVNDGT
jgi:hypothetical protein